MDPIQQFQNWFEEARLVEPVDAEVMALATATPAGVPSVRYVLYKGILEGGLFFVCNYESRKAQEMIANPHAALSFFWQKTYRQVRFTGEVRKLSLEASKRYFSLRPRESQIGAWASKQSHELESFSALEKRVEHFTEKFKGRDVDYPEFWGGFVLIPSEVEFWVGKPSRLHERTLYTRNGGTGSSGGVWKSKFLNP